MTDDPDLPLHQLRGVKDSPRGPILIAEVGGTIWLARGGPSPMGWRKIGSKKPGRKPNRWRHARPPIDPFLKPASFYEAKRQELRPAMRQVREDAPPDGIDRAAWWAWFHRRAAAIRELLHNWIGFTKLLRWAASFPQDSLEFLQRHGFRDRCWHLLSLHIRVPEGRELFDDFPQLAFALANSWVLRKKPVARPLRSLRRLVRRPRSEILRWLDLPPGDGVLHLLRRLEPEAMTGLLLARFKLALADTDRARWLASLPVPELPPDILGIFAFRQPVSFPILCAIANRAPVTDDPDGQTTDRVYFDILRMCHVHGEDPPEELHRITSKRRLLELHDNLVIQHQEGANPVAASLGWHRPIDPPLPPADFMEPIRDHARLVKEGRDMAHCVASHASGIVYGYLYIYAIHHPAARLTLSIRRDHLDHWHLDQLLGFRNAAAPEAARHDIHTWFAHAPQPAFAFSEDDLPF